jgi:Undecaprenyl-phosphate glucose phosphotransferase
VLKTYPAFFNLLRSVLDCVTTATCWITAYVLHVKLGLLSPSTDPPNFKVHLFLIPPICGICYLGFLWAGLYKSKRVQNFWIHFLIFVKIVLLNFLLIIAFLYYTKTTFYSRKILVIFFIMLFIGLAFSHLFFIGILKYFRKKGYNLRYYAIIGTGEKGRQLFNDIQDTKWLGLKCAFFIDNDTQNINTRLFGVPVYGPINKLPELIKSNRVDEIYLALSVDQAYMAFPVLETIQYTGITIRIVADWGHLVSISYPVVTNIGSQILFSASESPLDGFNIFVKHLFDFFAASFLLLLFSLPMILIAIIIKSTSKGPIFYKQRRVGMNQKEFWILKFRTMRTDTAKENITRWTTRNDSRCTPIGMWLRRTSLDELPQLLNVVTGQMSLVGPRPEQPDFAKQFSEGYKRYMLRHKVKAGMTGWAQIHGLRGDTSLRKRLLYDFYYIRNWSFGLDLWILLRTPWHIIKGENAY